MYTSCILASKPSTALMVAALFLNQFGRNPSRDRQGVEHYYSKWQIPAKIKDVCIPWLLVDPLPETYSYVPFFRLSIEKHLV